MHDEDEVKDLGSIPSFFLGISTHTGTKERMDECGPVYFHLENHFSRRCYFWRDSKEDGFDGHLKGCIVNHGKAMNKL